MQLRTFTLRFNPATESFDESAVTGFLADKEVVSLQNHFFVKNDVPYLLVVVCYRVASLLAPSTDAQPGSKRDESWRQTLTEADWPLFNTLRAWRSERCRQEGIPPYAICNNRQLAEMVTVRPQTPFLAVLFVLFRRPGTAPPSRSIRCGSRVG